MKHPIKKYVKEIQAGNRRFVGKTITFLESTLPKKFEHGQQILEKLLPYTGNSIRIGITGVPGVGKSTFIETFGLYLIEQGHRVAVLAIDPSSPISGGSIMGDKTRMQLLSAHEGAFIRPSPSGGMLGGVARKTKETIMVCEAAGYDVIIVETVGVGQSETTVSSMVDCFLVLMLPNAGDELQGIKKGVLEIADLITVNKADGDNELKAKQAAMEYTRALHFLRPPKAAWVPKVLKCSALQKTGIDDVWVNILDYQKKMVESGEWIKQRQNQARNWLWTLIEEDLKFRFQQHPEVQQLIKPLEEAIQIGKMHPTAAARQLLDACFTSQNKS
ncbi:MAG: methylmalonyl Co-A mutase-associated GTPase MeaB [SAR324 cluster bacterium]|nr:methylmalonyl Co-A mutase-associated GTPase MeaB [SAR324 cluster bacterium]